MTDNSTVRPTVRLSVCPSSCLSSRRFWVIANPANEPISVDPIGTKTQLQTEMESPLQLESKLSAWCSGRHISFQYMQHCWLASAELMWPTITSNDWLPKIPPNCRLPSSSLSSSARVKLQMKPKLVRCRRDATRLDATSASKCNIGCNWFLGLGIVRVTLLTHWTSLSLCSGWLCASVDQCGSVWFTDFAAFRCGCKLYEKILKYD